MTEKTEVALEEKLYSDKKLATNISKCPNCGGNAVFSAKDQKMKCNYCGSLFKVENEQKVCENDILDLLNNGKVWNSTEVYQCKTCGAKTIISKPKLPTPVPFAGQQML